MSERLPPAEYLSQPSKRPSIEALRERVKEGANPYVLIKNVLHEDAEALFDAFFFGTQADEDLMNLYDLDPTETYPFFFIDEFRSAANFLYPQFVKLKRKDPKDPSGETWMREHLKDHYGESGPGFDGAISAISGAAKLYRMITDPSPKKT